MAGLTCGAKCAKAVLFIFNGIFFLSGAALLGVGIWLKVDQNVSQYVNLAGGQTYFNAATILMICVGAFIFVVGFFGCCGAIKESSCMLCVYIVLLTIIFIIEIVAGVLAGVYRDDLKTVLQEEMAKQAKTQVKDLYPEDAPEQTVPNLAWQNMQVQFQCCGGNNYTDYIGNFTVDRPIPQTCCRLQEPMNPQNPVPVDWTVCRQEFNTQNPDPTQLWKDGCREGLYEWINDKAIILIGVGSGIAILQILGILFACCLRRDIANTPKAYA